MLKILDTQEYHTLIEQDLPAIRKFSLLENERIGWNYPLDYTFTAECFEKINQIKPITADTKILDVGCGPGAIHGYLENKYGVDIVGLDIHKWSQDYVDYTGDFLNPKIQEKLGKFDIIFSVSAFEHQPIESHEKCIKQCFKSLNKGGFVITTGSVAKKRNNDKTQFNLSQNDLERIYQDKFESFEYDKILDNWENYSLITESFQERYGVKKVKFTFLVFGYFKQKI
jgi:cyclopropane fatty-acyl-phospholipid synthase-like methyltransferase